MSDWSSGGPSERVHSVVPGLVHLRGPDGVEVFLEGVDALDAASTAPSRIEGVRIERDATSGGAFVELHGDPPRRFHVRSWRIHEPHPELFVAPLARFAPTAKEERTIRWLLRLLRVPGITRLIRVWHAWRTR